MRNTSPTNPTSTSNRHRRASSAASDLAKSLGIDLEAVSMAEARKVMSEEHKILGFRPPTGSFAAEVQSIAAKHPDGKPGAAPPDTAALKEIAREDARRILAQRNTTTGTDVSPPLQPLPPPPLKFPPTVSKPPATVRAKRSSPPPDPGVDLASISASDARALMSHEHRALGFRPPPGSLAAEAQSAAAARSRSRRADGDGDGDGDGDVGGARVDDDTLRAVALRDAERIMAGREMMTMTTMTMSGLGGSGGEGDDVGVGETAAAPKAMTAAEEGEKEKEEEGRGESPMRVDGADSSLE